jgi:hypothetical protein
MSDVTMCEGIDCPIRNKCYRYTAKPSEYWQAYFTEPPIKDGKCGMYWGENAEAVWNQLKEVVEISTPPPPPNKVVEKQRELIIEIMKAYLYWKKVKQKIEKL